MSAKKSSKKTFILENGNQALITAWNRKQEINQQRTKLNYFGDSIFPIQKQPGLKEPKKA